MSEKKRYIISAFAIALIAPFICLVIFAIVFRQHMQVAVQAPAPQSSVSAPVVVRTPVTYNGAEIAYFQEDQCYLPDGTPVSYTVYDLIVTCKGFRAYDIQEPAEINKVLSEYSGDVESYMRDVYKAKAAEYQTVIGWSTRAAAEVREYIKNTPDLSGGVATQPKTILHKGIEDSLSTEVTVSDGSVIPVYGVYTEDGEWFFSYGWDEDYEEDDSVEEE